MAENISGTELPRKVIGYLRPGRAQSTTGFTDAFAAALRQYERPELAEQIAFAQADENEDQFERLAGELRDEHPGLRVIVATTSRAAEAAKKVFPNLPVVIVTVGDPVGTGLIASLRQPGANVTGVTSATPKSAGRRLELLKEAFPSISFVAVLGNLSNPAKINDWAEIQRAAIALRVQLQPYDVRSVDDITDSFKRIREAELRPDAAIILGDPVTVIHRRAIVEEVNAIRLHNGGHLPTIYEGREFVEAGGLISYGGNRSQMYRRAAAYVVKLLGEGPPVNPADLPVEEPSHYELVVNGETERDQQLWIPTTVRSQAEELFPPASTQPR